MVIDTREPEILERLRPHRTDESVAGRVHVHVAAGHVRQEITKLFV